MTQQRIEKLRRMIEKSPEKPFPKYALALEYRNQGSFEEARSLFSGLVKSHPDYVATYFHLGQLLADLGKEGEAVEVFKSGLAVAQKENDAHAYSELEAALESLASV